MKNRRRRHLSSNLPLLRKCSAHPVPHPRGLRLPLRPAPQRPWSLLPSRRFCRVQDLRPHPSRSRQRWPGRLPAHLKPPCLPPRRNRSPYPSPHLSPFRHLGPRSLVPRRPRSLFVRQKPRALLLPNLRRHQATVPPRHPHRKHSRPQHRCPSPLRNPRKCLRHLAQPKPPSLHQRKAQFRVQPHFPPGHRLYPRQLLGRRLRRVRSARTSSRVCKPGSGPLPPVRQTQNRQVQATLERTSSRA